MAQLKIKMAGEFEILMNFRLCIKTSIVTAINVRRLEWAGHLVNISDDRTVKKVFLGKKRSRKIKIKAVRWY
jgi:hypothetical protein